MNWSPALYVGSEACSECHRDLYATYAETGHAHALTAIVDGAAPEFPFSTIAEPPTGYTWDDILYVVGGYGWMARFVDREGNVITGDAAQFNLPNSDLGLGNEWVSFHSGEQLAFDCAVCHTTGYVPVGNQHGLEAIVGTWAEDNVGCERCHGPGGNHVNDPYFVDMKVDRAAELCGDCHIRDDLATIEITDGFLGHNNQYGEIFHSTKRVMECIDCHNVHEPTKFGAGRLAIKTACENCHFQQAGYQKITDRRHATCVDCHMPSASKSAVSDPARFTADIRTHLFAINPTAISQADRSGTASMPYLALEFSCKGCHNDDGRGGELPDATLIETAIGFHERELAGTLNRR